jgi:hypothetical protein
MLWTEADFMARAGIGMVAAAIALAACTPDAAREAVPQNANVRIEIEEVLAPKVFRMEGVARVEGADGPPGLWVAAPGLPRPERGEVLNPATGSTVTAPLFRASGGGIRLSRAVADAIGMEDDAPVRLTAIRTEPRFLAFDRRQGLSYSDQNR